MDSQDHKITATSTGHDGHGVHLCHRCGWPFPNPHPSAKHRRAHKRVCGTIEGYKIIHSEGHDHHLAVSDDEHASDEDEHSPSPNLVKKNAEGSGKIGEKSNKSEDDVFSDAVTDFSDSGISPRLEERFESMTELDKSVEKKDVEGDVYGSGSLKVDETAARTEQTNDPRKSEEMTNPEPLVNGTSQLASVIPKTDASAKAVSGHSQIKSGQHADIQVQENNLESATSESEESKISDRTLTEAERQEELCGKLVPEVVKHDRPSQTETLQNLDASEGLNSMANSAKKSTSNETVEVAPVDETHEKINAKVGVKEVTHSTEEIAPVGAVDENNLPQESLWSVPSVKESSQTSDTTKQSDGASMVSSIDKEVEPETSSAKGEKAGSFDASKGEKCDMNGDENRNPESKESFPNDTIPAAYSAGDTFAPEDDQTTRAPKKDVDHCEEKSNSRLLETGNEKGKGASAEVQVIHDSIAPSDKSADMPSACAADTDAKNLEELSRNESSSVEFRDDDFEKSNPGLGTVGSELNRDIGDALDKTSSPTATSEDIVSPVISEEPHNIHVTKDVIIVESTDFAETVSKLKDNNEVVTSEKAPEQSISKDSTSLSTDSGLLSENSANDNSCTTDGAKASESIDTAQETAKVDQEDNVVLLREISESPTPGVQEATPTSKHLNVTTPGVVRSHLSEDFSTPKFVGNVSSAEVDGTVASDKCSVTPSLKEPLPSPLHFHETCATGDNKTVTNVEDVTCVDSKAVQAELDDKLTKENDGISAINLSGSLSSRSDSLEANCGSVVSDTLETNSQKHKSATEEGHPDKSGTFEPPSFMTLVQSGNEGDKDKTATEIETVQNKQQPKSDALQAGWFPSLKNVVNESEGRKKNEEIIAKVTNWSPVKQQHGPLKSLLNEVKSPNTKQVPAAANQKVETETKDNNAGLMTVGSVLGPETPATKDQNNNKDVEEWNSPARYPIESKKNKKKGRPFWVSFVCCTSLHRDL